MAKLIMDKSGLKSKTGVKRKATMAHGEGSRAKEAKFMVHPAASNKKYLAEEPQQNGGDGNFGNGRQPNLDTNGKRLKPSSKVEKTGKGRSLSPILFFRNGIAERPSGTKSGSMAHAMLSSNQHSPVDQNGKNKVTSKTSSLSVKALRKLTTKCKLREPQVTSGDPSSQTASKLQKTTKPGKPVSMAEEPLKARVKTIKSSKTLAEPSPKLPTNAQKAESFPIREPSTVLSGSKDSLMVPTQALKEQKAKGQAVGDRTNRKLGGVAGVNKMKRVGKPPVDGSPSQQAEWLWTACLNHFGDKLSPLEREPLTDRHFVALNASKHAQSTDSLSSLSSGIASCLKAELEVRRQREAAEPGTPLMLSLCAAALRCTEVLRALRPVSRHTPSAKLFSKHMKVEEQVEALKQPVLLAAGTPARVERLASLGALGLSELRLLLLDVACNAKGFTLLDIPETRVDFWSFYWAYLHKRVLDGQVRICLVA